MIIKFKIFENFNDVDPWGEEDWDVPDISVFKILPKMKKFVEKNIHHYRRNKERWLNIIGKTCVITRYAGAIGADNDICYYVKVDGDSIFDYIVPKDCLEKVESVLEHNELDPYGEEDDWNPREKEVIKKGDIVKCINPNGYKGKLSTKVDYVVSHIDGRNLVLSTDKKSRYLSASWIGGVWADIRDVKKKNVFESHNDLDPYDEEDDWNGPKIYTIDDLKIEDKLYLNNDFYGKISSINKINDIIKFKSPYAWKAWKVSSTDVIKGLNNGDLEII